MEQHTPKKILVYLPWILTLAALVALTLLGLAYRENGNPFEARFLKADLLSIMQIHLLEATEAEKNAILAITDVSSNDFANQARQAVDAIENGRKEIESIIHHDNLNREIEIINEFNACWSEYRELNKTILDLAIQNTNLKAQKLSASKGAQEMGNFEESLNRVITQNMHGNQCNKAVTLAYEALTYSLKIYALHKPHIEEAEDQEMDKIEQRIKVYDESARNALSTLRSSVATTGNEDLNNAEAAYQEFMNLTKEVIRLSRMNTNIKSAELSLGRKRLIAAQCQDILAELKQTVQTRPYQDATR